MYRFAYITNFLLAATAGVVFVLLSDLQDTFGIPTWGLGVIAGTGFLGALIVQLLLAPLADRGATLTVGAIGLAAGVGGSFWFVVADTMIGFAASRALLGVGAGLFVVASRKAVIGLTAEGSGAKLGALLSSSVAGFIFGPLLGAFLVDFGIDAPFIVLGVAIILVTPPTLWWLHQTPVATAVVPLSAMFALAKRPGIQASMIGQSVLFANVGVFDGTVDRYLTDLGAGNGLIALMLVGMGAPLVLLPSRTGALVDRRGGERVLVVSLFLAVPALLIYGLATAIPFIMFAGVMQGVVESFAFPATQVLTVKETGAPEAAIGQALLDITGSSTAMVWATLGPALYGTLGPGGLYAIAAANAAVLAVAVQRRLKVRDQERQLVAMPQ